MAASLTLGRPGTHTSWYSDGQCCATLDTSPSQQHSQRSRAAGETRLQASSAQVFPRAACTTREHCSPLEGTRQASRQLEISPIPGTTEKSLRPAVCRHSWLSASCWPCMASARLLTPSPHCHSTATKMGEERRARCLQCARGSDLWGQPVGNMPGRRVCFLLRPSRVGEQDRVWLCTGKEAG